jgi:hypothetical protein
MGRIKSLAANNQDPFPYIHISALSCFFHRVKNSGKYDKKAATRRVLYKTVAVCVAYYTITGRKKGVEVYSIFLSILFFFILQVVGGSVDVGGKRFK